MKWEYLTVTFVETARGVIIEAEGNAYAGTLIREIEKLTIRQQALDLIGEWVWELVSVAVLSKDTLMYTFKRKVT